MTDPKRIKAAGNLAARMHAEAPEVRAAGGAEAADADGWDLAAIDRDLREAGVEPTDETREVYRAAIRAHLSRLGARGGASKSARKAASSAENGRKGGRPRKSYSIRRGTKPGESYETMTVADRETGDVIAEYRLTPGSERAEIASMRRTIDRHRAKPGATLGNYGW